MLPTLYELSSLSRPLAIKCTTVNGGAGLYVKADRDSVELQAQVNISLSPGLGGIFDAMIKT